MNADTWSVDPRDEVGIKVMIDWGLRFNWFDDGDDWVPIMTGGIFAVTRRCIVPFPHFCFVTRFAGNGSRLESTMAG
jgi:hypothetical protein